MHVVTYTCHIQKAVKLMTVYCPKSIQVHVRPTSSNVPARGASLMRTDVTEMMIVVMIATNRDVNLQRETQIMVSV